MAKKKHKLKNQQKNQNTAGSFSDLSLSDEEIEQKANVPVEEEEAQLQEDTDEKEITETQTQEQEAQEAEETKRKKKEPKDHIILNEGDFPKAKWYVIHTYSGHEHRTALTLIQRIQSLHLEGRVLELLVPTQEKIQIKAGKRVNVREKMYPGYIFIKMILDDDTWFAVRSTQGITGFAGVGNRPTPISDSEVQAILKFSQTSKPQHKTKFTKNEPVRITDGPFADFLGTIDGIDDQRGKVKVLVSIFGRETPVELDFLQVQKV